MDAVRIPDDVQQTIFSTDRVYRYTLWREWDFGAGICMFTALNCSTADERNNDPTVTRCINFAKCWGYRALLMTNAFALRATQPRVMLAHAEPVGIDNDYWLMRCARHADMRILAWGNHGAHRERDKHVLALLRRYDLYCLRVTKAGQPEHPLYLPQTLTPKRYSRDGIVMNNDERTLSERTLLAVIRLEAIDHALSDSERKFIASWRQLMRDPRNYDEYPSMNRAIWWLTWNYRGTIDPGTDGLTITDMINLSPHLPQLWFHCASALRDLGLRERVALTRLIYG